MGILTSTFRDILARPDSARGDYQPGNQPLRIFIGYDPRQSVAYHVLAHSLFTRASEPVAISPLVLETLPIERYGLTPFTYTRFLVPWLCNYQGWALFLDLDMLVLGDIAEVFNAANDDYAMMVIKNAEQFEWASAMLFNCGHPANAVLTPQYIDQPELCATPHNLEWLDPALVGELPGQWNHTIGYDAPRADAKLAHYTQGVPFHTEVDGCEYSREWHQELEAVNFSRPWMELMGNSVHTQQLADGRVVPKLWRAEDAEDEQADTPRAASRDGASERYKKLIALYEDMHQRGDTLNQIEASQTFDGRSLVGHLQTIATVTRQFGASTMLDYGCGKALAYNNAVQLADGSVVDDIKTLWNVEQITLYDPGFAPYSNLPQGQFDGVVCTDVLEHCPEQDVHWIVEEIFSFARSFVYCTISCQPAIKKLPTGENAHITVHPPEWWQKVFEEVAARHPEVRYFATCYGHSSAPVMLNG